ncbi:MAG: hypothetical protein K0S61_2055 [Anaerocolumna sp.]|jgi:N-acetylmuramoyl-L-alanine amidase|nr:hypothetical protein [Anaerocolumna sp.]
MEERLLRKTAFGSFLCLLVVVALAILFSHDTKEKNKNSNNEEHANVDNNKDKKNISKYVDVKTDIGNKYITIKKPDEMNYNINIENLYMDNSILITIEDLDSAELQENYIKRINQDVEFIGNSKIGLVSKDENNEDSTIVSNAKTNSTGVQKSINNKKLYLIPEEIKADGSILTFGHLPKDMIIDPVDSFAYSNVNLTGNTGTLMEFHMDKVYEPFIYQDDKSIYIALKDPKEVYRKVIVLDAGHGGKDPGAYSKSFNVYEKEINLKILLQLKDIMEQNDDIKVYYTRLDDETVYLNPRVELANRVQADLFISIHCNASDSSMANGLEILYNQNDTTKGLNSKKLAELLFNNLKDITGRINRGLVPASEMVIVGKAKVPVALIETGFITCPEDYAVLSNIEGQKEFANSIYDVILKALK